MNCILVDDEKPARSELIYFIDRFTTLDILNDFDDAVEALEFVKQQKPDLVFLDINMPRLDGISFARQLKALGINTRIVFVTAHREFAVEAFELEAYDYLLKPFSEARIFSLLSKLNDIDTKNQRNYPEKLTLWKSEKMRVVPISDLCYVEVKEREVHLFTKEESYIVVSTISKFQKKLDPKMFFRCHRSYIINLDKIKEIVPSFNHTYQVKLSDVSDSIPVSRHYLSEFKQIIGNF